MKKISVSEFSNLTVVDLEHNCFGVKTACVVNSIILEGSFFMVELHYKDKDKIKLGTVIFTNHKYNMILLPSPMTELIIVNI